MRIQTLFFVKCFYNKCAAKIIIATIKQHFSLANLWSADASPFTATNTQVAVILYF